MRNKMFFLLFPLYMLVLVFILYINGVFAGDITSWSNLLINVGFLLVIGVLFLISAASFVRLNCTTDAIVAATEDIYRKHEETESCLWEQYRDRKDLFHNEVLDEAFARYQKRMAGYRTKRGLSGTCDLEEYINDDLLDRVGITHYNSAISGTLTGLGILGTFLGLSIGLGSFDGDDIYTISDNVGPLLEGMKVAFHTSVYGIFFSLIFNFIYRGIMADAYDKLEEFHAVYREYVAPSVENADENGRAMLIYQANIANSLRTVQELLKGGAAEQVKGVERITDRFLSRMEEIMGSDFERLGGALNYACKTQEQCFRDYQSMEQMTAQMQEVNRQMQIALEQMMESQRELIEEGRQQEEKISEVAAYLHDEVANQLYTYNQMREAYEK